jgi:hypothetical protein
MMEGLPATSEGEVYEAWLLRDGVPDPPASSSRITVPPPSCRGLCRRRRSCGGDRRTLGWLSSVPTSEPVLTAALSSLGLFSVYGPDAGGKGIK